MYIFIFILFFTEFLDAKIVDPDQMLRSVASDLGLHCLPMSQTWGAGHNRVKFTGLVKSNFYLVQQAVLYLHPAGRGVNRLKVRFIYKTNKTGYCT